MCEIQAFRGWRYNLARVGELSDVVAPPYDVIGRELQDALYRRHPSNVVRVELNRSRPQDSDSDNVYTRAAAHLRDWRSDSTLVQDPDPAIYVCHQTYTVDGQTHTRRGFLARLRLEPFGSGKIFAHEETMPGPKADRLRLMHATGVNVSPIFGLYPDAEQAVQSVLERAIAGKTPLQAADHLSVVTQLWPVSDHRVVNEVRGLIGPRSLYIADGHHRYETGLRYREDRRAGGDATRDDHSANFILAMCVAMSDPGLLILPTHRLVTGFPALTSQQLCDALTPEFEVVEFGRGRDGGTEAWELIAADGSQRVLGFSIPRENRWFAARLTAPDAVQRRVPQHSEAWCSLGVSILHEVAINDALRSHRAVDGTSIRYVHLLDEVLEATESRACDLACLVPPATIDDLQAIAGGGERMPAKSTYFYPKLLTGLVLNSLTSA